MRFRNRKRHIRIFFGDVKRFYTGRATPREVVRSSANVQFFQAIGEKGLAKRQARGTLRIYKKERDVGRKLVKKVRFHG